MAELFLNLIDKFVDDKWVLLAIFIVLAVYIIFMKKRNDFLLRKAYIDPTIFEEFNRQTKQVGAMFLPTAYCVQIICYYSAYLRGETRFDSTLYPVYYMPMLLIVVLPRIRKVYKTLDVSILTAICLLIPGTLFHILYLVLTVNKEKGILFFVAISFLGIILPIMMHYLLLYMISEKDKKMIKLEMKNGKIYYNRYNDVLDDGKDEYVSIKIRNKNGDIKKIKKVRREDIKEKQIYLEKPSIKH